MTEISNSYTIFYRVWFPIIILIVFTLLSIWLFQAEHIVNKTGIDIPQEYLVTILVITLFYLGIRSALGYRSIWVVFLTDEAVLLVRGKRKQTIPLNRILNIWQTELFYTRLIHLSFEDEQNVTHEVKFIGHFEANLGGSHHPVIDLLHKRMNAANDNYLSPD